MAASVAVQAAISARDDFEMRLSCQRVLLCLSGVAWTAAVTVLETAGRGVASEEGVAGRREDATSRLR